MITYQDTYTTMTEQPAAQKLPVICGFVVEKAPPWFGVTAVFRIQLLIFDKR
jgi:hypothetical protein